MQLQQHSIIVPWTSDATGLRREQTVHENANQVEIDVSVRVKFHPNTQPQQLFEKPLCSW